MNGLTLVSDHLFAIGVVHDLRTQQTYKVINEFTPVNGHLYVNIVTKDFHKNNI